MTPVQEKIELFNLLYSNRRIKECRNELLKKPYRIWRAFQGINSFPEDALSVEQICQFSSEARQHFIKVLKEGHVHRDANSKQLIIDSSPAFPVSRIAVFMVVIDLFVVLVSIFWLFTLENTRIDNLMKIFCLFSAIWCSRCLVLSCYNGILFLYLRQENLALLSQVDDGTFIEKCN